MSNRIRYKKMTKRPDVIESIKKYTSNSTGAIYLVRIDIGNMKYEVKNLRTSVIYRNDNTITNLNVLKRAAKRKLEKLGVLFNSEDRDRTFGICEKGYTQKKHVEEKYEGLRGITGIES